MLLTGPALPRPPAIPSGERPYPRQDTVEAMTTAEWARIPPVWVRLVDLIPTQTELVIDHLSRLLAGGQPLDGGDPYGHAVRWRGLLYCYDGHHRHAIEWLAGRPLVQVRIFCVDEGPMGAGEALAYVHTLRGDHERGEQ